MMKHAHLLTCIGIFILCGCVASGYPLIKKEESAGLISPGKYCFTKSHVTVTQTSQCGWIYISQSKDNGYTFNIGTDSHETITGGGSKIRKDKVYYARILNEPLSSGPMKGWNVLQVCESSKMCDYFALRKSAGGFRTTVTPDQNHIQTKQELLNHFTSQKDMPERVVAFYTKDYLDAQFKAMKDRQNQIRQQNEGDL